MADPITLPSFTDGTSPSGATYTKALETIRDAGQSLLESIETLYTQDLMDFNRAFQAVASRSARARKVLPPNTVAAFPVTDFASINQTVTTATVRANAGSATLRERPAASNLKIDAVTFSASVGNVLEIDQQTNTYQVTSDAAPVGTFMITLGAQEDISVLDFEILPSPSTPDVTVSVSIDGVTFADAQQVSVLGAQVVAWFNQAPTRYIQVVVSPVMPDAMSGNLWTFSLSSVSGQATLFNLASTYVSGNVWLTPVSVQVTLRAPADPGLTYYLSLTDDGSSSFTQVTPGIPAALPGVSQVTLTGIAPSSAGVLAVTLPSNIYLNTLVVTEQELVNGVETPVPRTVVPQLSSGITNRSKLRGEYVGISGTSLALISSASSYTTSRLFSVSYLTGPAQIAAALKVQLTTSNPALTPVFTGATLEAA